MKISFVIPCYRSEKTVSSVVNEIRQVMAERPEHSYEIVLVNDGSPDRVIDVIWDLAEKDPQIVAVDLMHNFGQANARMAGLNYSSGDRIVCLDDDGQCPVEKVWELLDPLEQGYDCAIANYPEKKQSWFKNFGSKANRRTARWVLDAPKDYTTSNFFAFTDLTRQGICSYKNAFPYTSGLIYQTTRNIKHVPMEERERISGRTGYTLSKLLALWLNGFTSFSIKPLRVADFMGICCSGVGVLFGIYTVIRRLMRPTMVAGYASIIASLFFLFGLNMLMLGLVGEYVGRIFLCINNKPQYLVRRTRNADTQHREQQEKVPC